MNATSILATLTQHRASDTTEHAHLQATTQFVERNPDQCCARTNLPGHLTASAFIVDPRCQHALLLQHAALGKWLQPGGHIDQSDTSPAAAARREAREETGLVFDQDTTPDLFDVDVHAIPARVKNGVHEPAHLHYDLRYLFIAGAEDVKLSVESTGFRWVAVDTLAEGKVESGIARMARKVVDARKLLTR
jgi:8-oxo-dGTP pyrophosphatase MutT (NUDIX family)